MSWTAQSKPTIFKHDLLYAKQRETWVQYYKRIPKRRPEEKNSGMMKSRPGKLQPTGHIHPTACFCTIHELKIVFTFLNGFKKSKGEWYFMIMWKLHEIKISVFINKVLLEATCTHLFIIYDHFPTIMAELSSCELRAACWVWPTKPKILTYYLSLCSTSLFTPVLRQWVAICSLKSFALNSFALKASISVYMTGQFFLRILDQPYSSQFLIS